MRILMAGGGTGGHLFPGLALAASLTAKQSRVRCEFIGTAAGLETSIIPASGYPLHLIAAGRGSPLSLSRPLNLPRFLLALMQSFRIVKRSDAAVIALGGYAAAAPGLVAKLKRVPLIVLEQNCIPGRVNRLLSRGATQVHNQFSEAVPHFPCPESICYNSGSPVREEIAALTKVAPSSGDALLIVGGSQGATRLNELTVEALGKLSPDDRMPIIHIAGAGHDLSVQKHYNSLNIPAKVYGFAENMPDLYQQSRLVISRAGAGSLTEMAAAGLPTILVPLPSARDNHQQHNAEFIAKLGGAIVLKQEGLTSDHLSTTIKSLWNDTLQCNQMAAAIRQSARPDAADTIADHILALSQIRS